MTKNNAARVATALSTLLSLTACNIPGSQQPLASTPVSANQTQESFVENPQPQKILELLRKRPNIPPQALKQRQLLNADSCVNVGTVAGSGISGHANGPAPIAQFSYPGDVETDAAGNIYATEWGQSFSNTFIRKISPDGQVSNFSVGPIESYFLTSDAKGNLYVSSTGGSGVKGHAILKVTPQGETSVLAGIQRYPGDPKYDSEAGYGYADGLGQNARFNFPWDLVADPAGNVYVSDTENYRIRKISPTGEVTTFAGTGERGFVDGPANQAKFGGPYGIALDDAGNLYVGDWLNYVIRKITPDGMVSTLKDRNGNIIYVGSSTLDVDKKGNIYTVEEYFGKVFQITPEGDVSTLTSSGVRGYQDGPGTTAQFNRPFGIHLDPTDGNLIVADTFNHRIRKVALCGAPGNLEIKEPAFSPNKDNIKDTNEIKVTAVGPWTLEVVGHPGTLDGQPAELVDSKTFTWNGAVNGIILDDGRYTLRLKTGTEEKTAKVIIDKTAPVIDGADVTRFDENLNNERFYTFNVKATDPLTNGAASELNLSTTEVVFKNATFSLEAPATPVGANEASLKYKLVSANPNTSSLDYTARISDQAGNSSQIVVNGVKTDPFSTSFSGSIQEELVGLATSVVGSSAAYRVQGIQQPPKRDLEGTVFYSQSGLIGQAKFSFGLVDRKTGAPLSGSKNVYIQDAHGRTYAMVNKPFTPEEPEIVFDWDGKDQLGKVGEPAHSGSYKITGEPSNNPFPIPELDPWIDIAVTRKSDVRTFKVSDHPCVTIADWEKTQGRNMFFRFDPNPPLVPSQLRFRYIAHILDRHIFYDANPNIYEIKFKRGEKRYDIKKLSGRTGSRADLFSTYDTDNVFIRPNNPLYGEFDEKAEFDNGYPETQLQFSRNTSAIQYLGMLNQMSSSIFKVRPASDYEEVGGREGKGRAMPCTFPSGKVIWVGCFQASDTAGLQQTAFNSIFPADKIQSKHEDAIK